MKIKNMLDLIIQKIRGLGKPTITQIILMGVGLIVGIGLLVFLRGFVACWTLTALPGIALPSCTTVEGVILDPEGTPVATTGTPEAIAPLLELPDPWDGASRVTILLIGLDYRDWESDTGAPRSDTMILMTLDPLTMKAGILSIPRDLWVNIPGYGYNRINAAYAFGEGDKLPGGGPGLAIKTVENFLGVEVNYYAQVDFITFEEMIDTIGGVCLDVPEAIKVGRTFEGDDHLEPGFQCLDGKSTLGYARARYTEGGDIDRSKRQQQVIRAIMDNVFDPVKFPGLVARAPSLYATLSSGIHTDVALDDILRLAVLVKDIPREDIMWGTIDYTMADIETVILQDLEQSVMRPFPDQIRTLVDSMFGSAALAPLAEGEILQKMQAEAARVVVVNGSGVAELAQRTADYFISQGMNVVAFGNPIDYPAAYNSTFPDRTIVIFHGEGLYAMQYIQQLIGFDTQRQIIFDYDPDAEVDVIIALGYDWGYNNPLP